MEIVLNCPLTRPGLACVIATGPRTLRVTVSIEGCRIIAYREAQAMAHCLMAAIALAGLNSLHETPEFRIATAGISVYDFSYGGTTEYTETLIPLVHEALENFGFTLVDTIEAVQGFAPYNKKKPADAYDKLLTDEDPPALSTLKTEP